MKDEPVDPPPDRAPPALVGAVARSLELEVVGPLPGGIFGAVLVTTADGRPAVLKVSPNRDLAPVWATGAAMTRILRRTGYPAPAYQGTGVLDGAVWSLQDRLPGTVPRQLSAVCAAQLVELIRRHDMDCELERDWQADALTAVHGWLDDIPAAAVADDFHKILRATLDRTRGAELLRTTIVHGDFHHRNCTVNDGEDTVLGIFDWEIAGPGDWRFDLVHLAFWCLVLPSSSEPDAVATVTRALRADVPDDVAAFMMVCQSSRAVSSEMRRRPDRVHRLSKGILNKLAGIYFVP